MPPDPIAREARAAAPQFDIAALRASPCGMAHERIRTGPDGLPLRDATTGGYSRPDLCPAADRKGNLGCSHTTARLALMRAFDGLDDGLDGGLDGGLEGDGIEALREELRSLDAALGVIDHRRHGAENRRADALWARDGGAAALAEDEIRAIIAEHRAGGLRAGEIRDLLAARLAERPRREGEVQAAPPALADPRSQLYAGR